jgi:glycosyltransferase involved in cell wall biosynthesis
MANILRAAIGVLRRGRRVAGATFLSSFDTGVRVKRTFQEVRESPAYRRPYSLTMPVVSVCIGTYNRAELLCERSLPSILGQSYSNLDIIVVGDCCTDDTERRLARVRDSRIRFVNLPRRGEYPDNPEYRWMVAGSASMNHALSLAAGDFITHLDDDDEHALDRIEKLLGFIRSEGADLVYHPFDREGLNAKWTLNEASRFELGFVTTSSVLYHHWFRQLDWDPFAYRFEESGDWNRFRRMKFLGARVARYPEALLRHYRERNQGISLP